MPEAQQIQPAPLPVSFTIVPVAGGGLSLVQMVVMTPAGQTVVFLDPKTAEGLAELLKNVAVRAKTGLVIPAATRDMPRGAG